MSAKAQIKTQAKTLAAPVATRTSQPAVSMPEHEAKRLDITTQLEGAARLGHSMEAVSVWGATPGQSQASPLIQCQPVPEDDDEEEELQLQREPAALQRQENPEEEEDEEELQMKREPSAIQQQEPPEEEEEEQELQMQPDTRQVGLEGGPVTPEVEAKINRARGGGQSLDGITQAQMGEMLGHDFSGVRVHTDAEADALNQQLSALAFTTGRDIFFRQGEYNPGSSGGRELIAHELIHVVQQNTGRIDGDGSSMTVRPACDTLENEADVQSRDIAGARYNASPPKVSNGMNNKSQSLTASMDDSPLHEGVMLERVGDLEVNKSVAQRDFVENVRNKGWAPNISQLIMKERITRSSTLDDLFRVVTSMTERAEYDAYASQLETSLESNIWNCISLTRLLVVLYAYTQDMNPDNPENVVEQQIHGRRLSKPLVMANIQSLVPNVVWEDPEGNIKEMYTFSDHTYVKINNIEYDPLMGTTGADIQENFPYVVENNQCTIDDRQYELTKTDGDVGPLPGYSLKLAATE